MTFRIPPKLGADRMATFSIKAPISTHTVPANCEDVDCQLYLNGWTMKLDLTTDLGRNQARYIKHDSGRRYEVTAQQDGLVTLTFSAQQECFQEHRVRAGRPEIFQVRDGDHRGNPLRTPVRTHKKAEFWLEEFQENQDRLKTQIDRG